jgi:TPR repeat protein
VSTPQATPQAPRVQTNMPIPRHLKRTDSDMSNNGANLASPIGNDQDEDLPRGREMQRTSAEQRTSWINNQFTWDTPAGDQRSLDPSTVKMVQRDASPTPSERLQKMAELQIEATERLGRDAGFSSVARSRSADPRAGSKAYAKHNATPSIETNSTDRTIRQTPLHQRAASAELTAEEHLEIGIQAHSSGSLTKSTYHLRLAAREGLPTAMLLYALACRHGWGMRPNQEDGVAWLRKAIESSGLEVADVEQTITNASKRDGKSDPVVEAAERRKRKAQFGLAVYELGISYMNGWGCQKDKPLALQCYEVAGGWGDCDALAEAGYCYTQGIGCKKDMKKGATLYRKAADLGMSMAGNSW